MRVESSIITSLSELRAIEQQRIADERTAIERERAAEIEAKRATEQAVRDAEERKLREEREALVRIEQARVDAEREARMRVQAAEAAERARFTATLEQQRMQEELELRRQEVAKKRPTWMLAVTGLAMVAAVGLGFYAYQRNQDQQRAEASEQAAIRQKQIAVEEAQRAKQELDRLAKQMEEQDARIAKAQELLLAAQTQADRDRIAADIRKANQEKANIRAAQRKAEDAAAAAARAGGAHVDECLTASAGSICGIDGPKKKRK